MTAAATRPYSYKQNEKSHGIRIKSRDLRSYSGKHRDRSHKIHRGNMSSSERKSRVTESLERVGMGHRAKHLPSQLSGGQQQRVAVARAVGGQPSILLADEPTGNLDSTNGEAVMELLRELHRGGATICMVTHDARYAQHADRIVHLFDGLIVEEEAGANRREIEDAKRELKESGFGEIA